MKEITIISHDGYKLHCSLWDDTARPKGVIQLVHGMASYGARYDEFAEILNKSGYIAFADDHRGHGKSAKIPGVVDYDNFNQCVKDQIHITRMLKAEYKLPVQLFAHSFGSFLAQRYIQLYDDIDGVILSGSAHMGGKTLKLGIMLTAIRKLFIKSSTPSKFLYNLSFKANNKPFLSEGLINAWINRDSDAVRRFNEDPSCGFIMSEAFYYSLMRGLWDAVKKENIASISSKLPIMIMSGRMDPVGGMGEKVLKLYNEYKANNLNVSLRLYDDVRHELTSDPDKDKLIAEMIEFYNNNLKY
ncbi:MAG: alpha/beta fold hydrolase [Christensenellales bacterium]|jgi:alpha-beta hydrolase superfamily lysophospholipase